jgi:hypothetical protein
MPQAYFGCLHPHITITNSMTTKLHVTPRYNPLLNRKKCKALCMYTIFYSIVSARHCVSPIYNLKVLLCYKRWINLVEQVQNLRVTTNSQNEVCISLTLHSWILIHILLTLHLKIDYTFLLFWSNFQIANKLVRQFVSIFSCVIHISMLIN